MTKNVKGWAEAVRAFEGKGLPCTCQPSDTTIVVLLRGGELMEISKNVIHSK